jgi:GH25 family lysozyme M1 (1,4-beta-N-acetylmuramidase)
MATTAEKYAELLTLGIALDPILPIIEVPFAGGTFFTFNGSPGPVIIYNHPAIGANEVYGAILTSYLAQGGPAGALGFPVSGEYDDMVGQTAVGRISDFQNGSISWDRASGLTDTFIVGPISFAPDFEMMSGIDVSQFQETIDWAKTATLGTSDGEVISFAYIRATHDDTGVDMRFTQNWSNSAGHLPRGAYHFFKAHAVPDQTRQQLDLFVNTLVAVGGSGELPPMVDVESLPAGVSAAQAEQSLRFFLSLLEQAFGVRPLIYTFPYFWKHQMANTNAFSNTNKLWIANYGPKTAEGGFAARSTAPILVGGWSEFALWQHAVKSGVGGITTLVDRDQVLVPTGQSLADFLR